MVVKWLPDAKRDLKAIFDFYLEVAGRRVAGRIRLQIKEDVDRLVHNPEMAPVEPLLSGFKRTYRSLLSDKNYKIVHSIDRETIYIIAVWDCRQDPDKLKNHINV